MWWREPDSAETIKKRLIQKLSNYKQLHQDTAKKKNVVVEFNSAKTLTQARKILFN